MREKANNISKGLSYLFDYRVILWKNWTTNCTRIRKRHYYSSIVVSKQKVKTVLWTCTVCFWLTLAVGAVLGTSGFHFGPVGFCLRAFRLGRLAVVHLLLLTAPRPPSTHIQITVAELTGAFSHWTHTNNNNNGLQCTMKQALTVLQIQLFQRQYEYSWTGYFIIWNL